MLMLCCTVPNIKLVCGKISTPKVFQLQLVNESGSMQDCEQISTWNVWIYEIKIVALRVLAEQS